MLTETQSVEAAVIATKIIDAFKRADEPVALQAIVGALSLTLRLSAPSYEKAKLALDDIAQCVDAQMKAMFDEPLSPLTN